MYIIMINGTTVLEFRFFQCQWTLSTRSPISLPFSEHSFLHSLYLVLLCVFFSNFSSLFSLLYFCPCLYLLLRKKKKKLHAYVLAGRQLLRTPRAHVHVHWAVFCLEPRPHGRTGAGRPLAQYSSKYTVSVASVVLRRWSALAKTRLARRM